MSPQHVPDLNPGRSSWVFVSLQTQAKSDPQTDENRTITSWRLAVGNTDQLVRKVNFGDIEHDDPVTSLGDELLTYQNENSLLITPTCTTLHCLRSNLFRRHKDREETANGKVIEPVPRPTLHGYRHLPIKETLDQHFDDATHILSNYVQSWEREQDESLSVEVSPGEMWSMTRTIIPLLPIEIGQGQPL